MSRLSVSASIALVVVSTAAIAGAAAAGTTPTTTVPAPTTAAATTVAATTAAATTAAPTTVAATPVPTTVAPSISSAPTTAAPTTVTTVPPVSGVEVRAAKVGWARFVTDNFATPNAILDPCPLLAVADANAGVAGLGLTPTDLPFGVSLYRDVVGVGIIGITCGADLSEPASPAGATLFAVEVTILDGQAVFPQYVERVAGRNTPIERAVPELGDVMFARCRNDPQVCIAGWHFDGLVITVKLDGPRTADSETHVRQLLVPIARQVVTNLAAVPAGP